MLLFSEDTFSFIFFPARLVCNLLFGRLLSFPILLGQIVFQAENRKTLTELDIKDGALNNNHQLSEKNQYVIYFGGNVESATYKGVYDRSFYAINEELKTFLIKYDYPGVGNSAGYPSSYLDLVDGAEKVINKLLNKGIKPEQIILHGLSLGGAISLYAYKRMLDKGVTLGGVFNDRSFSTLSDAALGMLGVSLYDSNIISKLFYIILKPIVKALLWLCMWEMNPYKIYNELDSDKKDFIAVANYNNYSDGVIHHGASMFSALNNNLSNKEQYELNFNEHLFFNDCKTSMSIFDDELPWPWPSCQHMAPELNCNINPDSKIQNHKEYFQNFQNRIYRKTVRT